MEKTKIGWCDSTWNPVTGCYHGCEYCYARGYTRRFEGFDKAINGRWNTIQCEKGNDRLGILNDRQYRTKEDGKIIPALYPFGFMPTFHRYRLDDYANKEGRNIFVCSMADLFGKWVPDEWIEEVFATCEKAPQHNYLFLTKNPKRYIELSESNRLPISNNMWYGSTVTSMEEYFSSKKTFNTFVSIEPMFSSVSLLTIEDVKWIIVGAETGRRKDKIVPQREWIENLLELCRKADIPLFMKSSLTEIWGEPLIQEFPKKLRRVS